MGWRSSALLLVCVEYDADNLQISSQVNASEWDSQSNSQWEGFCCHFNVNIPDYDTILIYNSIIDHHTVDYFLSQPHNVLFLAYSVYTPCFIKEKVYYAFLILDSSHVVRSNWESAMCSMTLSLATAFSLLIHFLFVFFPSFFISVHSHNYPVSYTIFSDRPDNSATVCLFYTNIAEESILHQVFVEQLGAL